MVILENIMGRFESESLFALVLITFFYGGCAYVLSRKFIQWGEKKWHVSSPSYVPLLSVLSAVLPNIVYLIIDRLSVSASNVSDRIYYYNALAWSHWGTLMLLFAPLIVIVGIGKWRWQYVLQALMVPYIVHILLDFFLYQVPIYFLYPYSPYDVQPYGFDVAVFIDQYTFPGFLELSLLVLLILYVLREQGILFSNDAVGDSGG